MLNAMWYVGIFFGTLLMECVGLLMFAYSLRKWLVDLEYLPRLLVLHGFMLIWMPISIIAVSFILLRFGIYTVVERGIN